MATTYKLISSNVLTSSAANVTLSSIPATYTDLVLRCSARADYASAYNTDLLIQLNGITATSYSVTRLEAYGSTPQSLRQSTSSNVSIDNSQNAALSTSNTFSNFEIYIPSYTASQNKPFSIDSVMETNDASNNRLQVDAALFRNTAAITSIKLYLLSTYNFVSGSSFYLYGINNS
jgi:hypothetical protein